VALLLVVDDDPTALDFMRAALAAAGHEVLVASSAHEAMRVALGARIALAVVDMVLPGFDGSETARALRSVAGYTQLPVVAVSGHREAAKLIHPPSIGARRLLMKPFTGEQLLRAVEECLEGRV
jgi:DNA-binding response OmpR family regulator